MLHLDSRKNQSPKIVVHGHDGQPLSCTTKSCSGSGFETLKRWLGEEQSDVLFLHNGRGEPLVLLTQDAWARIARGTIGRGGTGQSMAEEPTGYSSLLGR